MFVMNDSHWGYTLEALFLSVAAYFIGPLTWQFLLMVFVLNFILFSLLDGFLERSF